MTDEERDLYLRALRDGSPESAALMLKAKRGSGPTTRELLALDELDLIELAREATPGSSGAQNDSDPIVEVIGLTGNGEQFAEDLG